MEPSPPSHRYQWARPGELLHLDIEKLGRIGQVGHRVTGDRRHRVRGIGWEFVHVCIDDASRIAFSRVMKDERKWHSHWDDVSPNLHHRQDTCE
jgi:hypothetical protein